MCFDPDDSLCDCEDDVGEDEETEEDRALAAYYRANSMAYDALPLCDGGCGKVADRPGETTCWGCGADRLIEKVTAHLLVIKERRVLAQRLVAVLAARGRAMGVREAEGLKASKVAGLHV